MSINQKTPLGLRGFPSVLPSPRMETRGEFGDGKVPSSDFHRTVVRGRSRRRSRLRLAETVADGHFGRDWDAYPDLRLGVHVDGSYGHLGDCIRYGRIDDAGCLDSLLLRAQAQSRTCYAGGARSGIDRTRNAAGTRLKRAKIFFEQTPT